MRRGLLNLAMVAAFVIASKVAGIHVLGNGISVGTRDYSVPMGQVGSFGDFDIRVMSYNPHAYAELTSREDQNEHAGPGNTLLLVRIETTYRGNDAMPPDTFRYSFVGDSNAALPDVYCSTYGHSIHDEAMKADLFPGGSSQFEICLEAPTSQLAGLKLYVSDVNGNGIFFELSPSSQHATPESTPARQLLILPALPASLRRQGPLQLRHDYPRRHVVDLALEIIDPIHVAVDRDRLRCVFV